MKKIDFGYNTASQPNGTFEGIGISPNGWIVGGELVDLVSYENQDYLISKVTQVFSGHEDLVGTIDVRRIIADLYRDGSGNLYVTDQKDYNCEVLRQIMERPNVKEQIEQGISLVELSSGVNPPSDSIKMLTSGPDLSVVGIKPEVFEQKRKLLQESSRSFSDMAAEIEMLRAKLREQSNEMEQTGLRH